MSEVSLWDMIDTIATIYTFYCCIEHICKKLFSTKDKNVNNHSNKRHKRKHKRRK